MSLSCLFLMISFEDIRYQNNISPKTIQCWEWHSLDTHLVKFYTSYYGSQIHKNPDNCSLKIYPLSTFLNRTDNKNKSHCDDHYELYCKMGNMHFTE